MSRTLNRLKVTRRLILMTAAVLAFVVTLFGVTLVFGGRFLISWACFGCGLLGGFVSIQQRLSNLDDEALELLAASWFQIVLIPVYGGLFALALYLGFLSGIVSGGAFPTFAIPAFHEPPTTADLQAFFSNAYPATGSDLAKLLFWSIVAGFSERFVPQIIGKAGGPAKD
jgi:hypothetical protein